MDITLIRQVFKDRREHIFYDILWGKSKEERRLVFIVAAEYGNLDLLRWMTRTFNLTKEDATASYYWPFKHSKVTWFQQKIGLSKADNAPFRYAAHCGQLEVLKWLVAEFRLERKDVMANYGYAFTYAGMRGHLNVLKWLAEEYDITEYEATGGLVNALNLAIERGHLDVVQWLTEKYKLTSRRFEWALHYGKVHPSVVTYIRNVP